MGTSLSNDERDKNSRVCLSSSRLHSSRFHPGRPPSISLKSFGPRPSNRKKYPITMEWLFGRKMTPDEMLRKNQRALNKAMRELDRERMKMEQQEKKIIADIKKMAKQGQMDAV